MLQVLLWLNANSLPWDTIVTTAVAVVLIGLLIAVVSKAYQAFAQARVPKFKDDRFRRPTQFNQALAGREALPNILVGAATNRAGKIKKDTLAILNAGGGRAKDLRLRYRDQSGDSEIRIKEQLLVVRDVIAVPIDVSRAAASGLQLTYRTDFGTHCALDFDWDAAAARAEREKLTLLP